MDSTLASCLNAKNSLGNIHVFSHFNSYLDTTITYGNKPPAVIQHDTSKIITNNLTALDKVRKAFILSKSSEKR